MRRLVAALAFCASLAASAAEAAPVSVVDDGGQPLTLPKPPSRIVTLAPSLAELVFAAGAGAALVGTTSLSDFPDGARRVARVGDASRLDVERVLALKPDLVIVWQRGNLGREIGQIGAAGIPLFRLEPRRLDEVPAAIERLGALLGHDDEARRHAADLRATLARLRQAHARAEPVRVFFQVWQSPLLTVNGSHLIADVMALCGGRNVFADVAPLVPAVSIEAVVAADPEAIVTADEAGGSAPPWQRATALPSLAVWQRYPRLAAVRHGWLFALNGDLISRQGPRIALGAEAMCAALDAVRRERARR